MEITIGFAVGFIRGGALICKSEPANPGKGKLKTGGFVPKVTGPDES